MPRSIWTGAISFGLVNVPVKLYSATDQKDVRFNQFQEGTGQRIRYKRVAEDTGDEVPYENIVKGYEIEKGRYVIVTPEELEAVEPGRTRTIDIEDFIDLDEIDPIYFEKTYFLAPEEGSGAAKAYALLREAMSDSNKVAVGRFVMRTKQYLCTIRPSGDTLLLETMFFPDEVRSTEDLEDIPGDVDLSSRERDIARQLVESLSAPWRPDRYHDTYRERVLDLIERKAKGEDVVVHEPEQQTADVVDLVAALEASLRRTRGERGDGERAAGGDDDLASKSKDELYEEAKRRNVPGRSDMSKDELIDALRKAS